MSFEIGQRVAGYEVVGTLGKGGMGSVFKVRNLISDRIEALKVLLPDLHSSPEMAERFVSEIKVLAGLQHRNIAALHTALHADNRLLMVMEFVDGVTLEERAKSPVSVSNAVDWFLQALNGLAYAHSRGVIHRDIKPANMALNSAGEVKLLDFGLARGETDRRLTKTGMVLGSLHYMSPEQVNGAPADARSDLYSLAVSMYRVITGAKPFEGASEFDLMRAQVSKMPAAPETINPWIPVGLSDAIMRGLMKEPARRFQSAAEFAQAIRPFGDPARTDSQTVRSVPPPTEQPTMTIFNPPPSSGGAFAPAAVAALEKHLVPRLGPIAASLVRKEARSAGSLNELAARLAGAIPSEAERRTFLLACSRELGTEAPTPTPSAPAAVSALDPAKVEQCKKQLANYMGPLAKVLVDRAAKNAASLDHLWNIVAANIPSEKDRDKFLKSRV